MADPSSASFPSLESALSLVLIALWILVSVQQFFRYRRREQHLKLYAEHVANVKGENGTSKAIAMETARMIQFQIGSKEFPFTYRKSLEFALFRTYAIPSISGLLAKTGVFESYCGLRYDDTDLLIAEMVDHAFDSTRSQSALQRINAIHNQYRNEISNNDMLYVLSVFILEPIRWIDKLEWRKLTEEEKQSFYMTWTHVGERMGIRNIPPTLQAYAEWNQKYEQEKMVFAKSNTIIANATMDLFMSLLPSFLHPFGKQASYCLMDARLRAAMGYPKEVSKPLCLVLDGIFMLRQFALRYLSPPRPEFLTADRTPAKDTPIKVPKFHVYECTYRNGYRIDHLGIAPKDKLMKECPFWKD